jgi:hypothetical protein
VRPTDGPATFGAPGFRPAQSSPDAPGWMTNLLQVVDCPAYHFFSPVTLDNPRTLWKDRSNGSGQKGHS